MKYMNRMLRRNPLTSVVIVAEALLLILSFAAYGAYHFFAR